MVVVKRLRFPDEAMVMFIKPGTTWAYYIRRYSRSSEEGERLLALLDLADVRQMEFTDKDYKGVMK